MLKQVVVIEKNYKNMPPLQKGGSTDLKNFHFLPDKKPAMKKKKTCK